MKRIIIIGNGFDKAHGLPTGYTDFMDSYWKDFAQKVNLFEPYGDDLIKFENIGGPESLYDAYNATIYGVKNEEGYNYNGIIEYFNQTLLTIDSYDNIKSLITEFNNASDLQVKLSFKNDFWRQISEKTCLNTWLDIENEYYDLLKSYLKVENRNESVKKLNKEFSQIKKLLEKYLTEVCQRTVTKEDSIEKACKSVVWVDDVAILKRKLYFRSILSMMSESGDNHEIEKVIRDNPRYSVLRTEEEAMHAVIEEKIRKNQLDLYLLPIRLILNFNYTDTTQKLYANSDDVIINIHGELNNKSNPIIFGYGDELDDNYREIEKTNDKDFLDNIKSIHYHSTKNYRRLLEFLQDDVYQIFTMGHSCGNSDRTLLNTIFEHPNCISVKPFFHEWENGDDYTDIIKNISRNFPNKQNMRDIVVNREHCEPLIPIKS